MSQTQTPDRKNADTTTDGEVRAAMADARTQHGATLLELSQPGPLLIVFLRHLGCPFCREILAEVRERKGRLDEQGVRVAFVHMGQEEQARPLFERFDLGDAHRVSDPDQRLYQAFRTRRGGPWALSSPYVLWRLLKLAIRGILPGRIVGDVWRLSGAFLVRDARIEAARRAKTQADDLDVCGLAGA